MTEFPAVLSLTILSPDRSRILVGVRRAENNPTHPDIISTPTQRIPSSILEDIITGCTTSKEVTVNLNFPERIDQVLVFGDPYTIKRQNFESINNPYGQSLLFVVDTLLARKLGQASYLAMDNLLYLATPKVLVQGAALYDRRNLGENPERYGKQKDHQLNSEDLQMLNVEVVLDRTDTMPSETASYSPLVWISRKQFQVMNEERHTFGLPNELNGSSYCAHGMCLLSSYAAITFQ
tara:strand:- start:40783 stop:41490 length:708 start_codon:yes stop_codon:yes gene_type:complete